MNLRLNKKTGVWKTYVSRISKAVPELTNLVLFLINLYFNNFEEKQRILKKCSECWRNKKLNSNNGKKQNEEIEDSK